MSYTARFGAYAGAFEKAFESDDWSLVEPFFTEDAVYEVGASIFGPRAEGRDAVLAHFKQVLDRFDRRFAVREIELLEGPREKDDSVWLRGTATYRSPGVPEFSIELEETAWFDGDRIRRLEDVYVPESLAAAEAYLDEYGRKLGIERD